jgi:hypothetical protein
MKGLSPLLMAAALAAAATPALAEKSVPANKVLPFLDKFLKVPPAERSRVRLTYAVRHDGQPMPNLKATLVEKNGARTPLPVNADGYFDHLPTLAQLDGDPVITFDVPPDFKMGAAMNFGTQLKPAAEYDVRELAATVDEANSVIGKAAGPMAIMAPKMSGVAFPKADSGVVVFADGRTQPLPEAKETPYFRPVDFKGAVRVKLTKTPTKVGLYDGKK